MHDPSISIFIDGTLRVGCGGMGVEWNPDGRPGSTLLRLKQTRAKIKGVEIR